MRVFIFISICFLLFSCRSSFSRYSDYSTVEICDHNDVFVCINNDSLKLKYVSFGGFHFAKNDTEFKKLNGRKPKFKNILIYGKSEIINSDYYLLIDSHRRKRGFIYKDSLIGKTLVTVALSYSCHPSNQKVLLNGLKSL